MKFIKDNDLKKKKFHRMRFPHSNVSFQRGDEIYWWNNLKSYVRYLEMIWGFEVGGEGWGK